MRYPILVCSLLLLVTSTGNTADPVAVADPATDTPQLEKAIIFRATFDKGPVADIAAGDKQIYTGDSLERKVVEPGIKTDAVKWEKANGRSGGALSFTTKTKELIFFKGGKNLPYAKKDFQGTVSLWMKLSPKEDLPKGYVDPLQITDKKWNDSSFFIDFDQSEARPFRLGVFSDFAFWNPTNRKFDDIPAKERPMVSVSDWPFDRSKWTHVAFAWSGFNTDKSANATLYLDGKSQGSLSNKQQMTWDAEKAVIMLGINYVGLMDDLIIFDRSLSADEIRAIGN